MERKFTLKDNFTGEEAKKVTEVTFFSQDDRLKLLFICSDSDIISKGKSYNDRLYEGDVAELFLTLGERSRYLELEVNPDGAQYAGIVENDNGKISITYLPDSPFVSKTERTESGWTSEWEIDLKTLRALGYKEENAYFNLYRQDFEPDGKLNLYALCPTYKPTFHDINAFIKYQG